MNPLVMRVISIFDTKKDDQINFKQFIETLSVFSHKGDKRDKLWFAFRVYDIDEDGFISSNELFQVLKMMVGNNLSDWQLQQIVNNTVVEADSDGDGFISFDEFADALSSVDLESKMTIRFN